MKEIPKGFTCECGAFHEFGFYVAAHADIRLTHTCKDCGAKHDILRYHVSLMKKGKKRLSPKISVGPSDKPAGLSSSLAQRPTRENAD